MLVDAGSYRNEESSQNIFKTFLGKVTNNLDKVLAVLLIFLLLLFFMQSSRAPPRKPLTTEALLAPELIPSNTPSSTNSKLPASEQVDDVIAPKLTLEALIKESDSEMEDNDLLAHPVKNKGKEEKHL